MAAMKRARPAFSPPRPGKSKPSGNKASSNSKSKTSVLSGVRKRASTSTATEAARKRRRGTGAEQRRRSRLVSPTQSEEDESMDEDDASKDGDEASARTRSSSSSRSGGGSSDDETPQSPEPDFILAEITHEHPARTNGSADPAIPLPLLHRILQQNFKTADGTRISTDARAVVGRYVDVFVREAIMRCAYEREGLNNGVGEGAEELMDGAGNRGARKDDGWLEVEDLERVAVQLCLDF